MARGFRWLLVGMVVWGLGCGDEEDPPIASDARERLERAWRAYAQRDFSTALVEFERASRLNPRLADAKNGIGWTHLSLVAGAPDAQTLQTVIGAFLDALREEDGLADAWIGLGHALFLRRGSRQDYLDAARALDSALKADPSSLFRHDYTRLADVYALQAWCYYYADDVEAARQSAEKALADNPKVSSASLLMEMLRER